MSLNKGGFALKNSAASPIGVRHKHKPERLAAPLSKEAGNKPIPTVSVSYARIASISLL